MVDYYNQFIKLSLQQCLKCDYSDKAKVKLHNIASKKLHKLFADIKNNNRVDILDMLLSHNDDRVRINAANLSLQMSVLSERATDVLSDIILTTKDPTLCFSAKMILKNMK